MTGCYSRNIPEGKEKLPEVDHWVSIAENGGIEPVLRMIESGAGADSAEPSEFAAGLLLGHRRTFIKIQDGCDFNCSYCVVPLARGKSRSIAEKEIIEKAVAAEREGARELVLTGIHVGLYGFDRGEKEGLSGLVSILLEKTSLVRLRLTSIEPMEVTDRLLSTIGGNARVCQHLHVPMQSGCDRVLVRMRRPYDESTYTGTVGKIFEKMPGAQIGTDVIAGFPGESDEDFDETLNRLASLPVHYMHVFPYSPRPGTDSSRWKDDVPPAVKKKRVSRLLELDVQKRNGYLQSQVGKVLEVLAESAHREKEELSGYSGNYVEVFFPGDASGIGELTAVRAISTDGRKLYATREGVNV
jgi:threonylcarbamoyladenosine tRNA methylthiotransferase MtaB